LNTLVNFRPAQPSKTGQFSSGANTLSHEDLDDALTCAFLAYLFAKDREKLDNPDESIAPHEGWIWVPKDVIV